jgi:excisionase family DNA binding protein
MSIDKDKKFFQIANGYIMVYNGSMQNEILTVAEFAAKIKVKPLTVLKLIKEGKILAFRLSEAKKSPYRIKESEIERLITFELERNRIKKDTSHE